MDTSNCGCSFLHLESSSQNSFYTFCDSVPHHAPWLSVFYFHTGGWNIRMSELAWWEKTGGSKTWSTLSPMRDTLDWFRTCRGRSRSEILACTLLLFHLSVLFSLSHPPSIRTPHRGLRAHLSSRRKEMQSRLHRNSGKRHRTSLGGKLNTATKIHTVKWQ